MHFEALPEEIFRESPPVFAAHINRAIERMVEGDPAQYQWEYKRFKRQPAGEPRFY
ncbi:MAG: hypothetical protein HC809_04035 [Gammaproteobacteria bacterium]|nr:hypothetical protein [Gammaproteobacteria bacterium]